MRAGRIGFKRVEGLGAFAVPPQHPAHRPGLADGAGETLAARDAFKTGQRARLHSAFPTVEEDEAGQHIQPGIMRADDEGNQGDHREAADHRGDHQTARPSKNKPEQGPQNFSAIKRIDREQVEDQQDEIREPDGTGENKNALWFKNRPEDQSAASEAITQRAEFEKAPWWNKPSVRDFGPRVGDAPMDIYELVG